MTNGSANDQSWRTTLPVAGFAYAFLTISSIGCQSGPPQSNGSQQNASGSSLFSSFGQTRVAPPATGSYAHSSTPMINPSGTDQPQGTETNQSPIRQLPAPGPSGSNTRTNQKSGVEVWPQSFGPRSSMTPAIRGEQTSPLSFTKGLPATDLTQVSAITQAPGTRGKTASENHPQTHVIASRWESTLPVHANYNETYTDEPKNVAVSSTQSGPPNASRGMTITTPQQTRPQTPPRPINGLDWRKPSID